MTYEESEIIRAVRDRGGRAVVLTQERMDHIVRRHRKLDGHELAIMRAVETADIRCRGNDAKSEELYARNLGPSRWLCVVVGYEGVRGHIRTAYPHRRDPPTEGRL